MLRRVALCRISPYAYFLQRPEVRQRVSGMRPAESAPVLKAMWAASKRSPKAHADLCAAALAVKPKPRKAKSLKRKRRLSAFASYVKANHKSVKDLPFGERLKTLSARYRAAKSKGGK